MNLESFFWKKKKNLPKCLPPPPSKRPVVFPFHLGHAHRSVPLHLPTRGRFQSAFRPPRARRRSARRFGSGDRPAGRTRVSAAGHSLPTWSTWQWKSPKKKGRWKELVVIFVWEVKRQFFAPEISWIWRVLSSFRSLVFFKLQPFLIQRKKMRGQPCGPSRDLPIWESPIRFQAQYADLWPLRRRRS